MFILAGYPFNGIPENEFCASGSLYTDCIYTNLNNTTSFILLAEDSSYSRIGLSTSKFILTDSNAAIQAGGAWVNAIENAVCLSGNVIDLAGLSGFFNFLYENTDGIYIGETCINTNTGCLITSTYSLPYKVSGDFIYNAAASVTINANNICLYNSVGCIKLSESTIFLGADLHNLFLLNDTAISAVVGHDEYHYGLMHTDSSGLSFVANEGSLTGSIAMLSCWLCFCHSSLICMYGCIITADFYPDNVNCVCATGHILFNQNWGDNNPLTIPTEREWCICFIYCCDYCNVYVDGEYRGKQVLKNCYCVYRIVDGMVVGTCKVTENRSPLD